MSIWQPVYIGVGSNLDDPGAQVRFAVSRLEALAASRVVYVSPLYGSRAFGPIAQPDYVNAVVGALTQLDSHKMLSELQALERSLGRPAQHQKWGPRVIDLDLLKVRFEVIHSELRTAKSNPQNQYAKRLGPLET